MENNQFFRTVRVFIASPFFNEEQLERIGRLENALRKNPYVADFFSARFYQFPQLTFASDPWRKTVFQNDLRYLRRADVVVAIHDYEENSVDSGTAFELGYAYALQKPIILIKEKETSIPNLMLVESLHAYLTAADEIAGYDFINMPKIPYKGPLI
ncbi:MULTISPECIES: nucleoside 2-deoxyribosyltransferase [Bacillaceae]|uniref:nucleoside 2-deoxyribosyltransferase n=1 Tax=Bacillaceae TaxID=186817 RepID=UPI001CD5AA4B|nr:nucleoside 2-deoxyribosyltransferase [Bacillus infantis]MCA1035105.1 nucleoside 2-deoxyribosyltransferase [Bacillus infantis]MDW2877765.1 nucleoside 2-deoxyribosyltransferase [Bacillus infantis]